MLIDKINNYLEDRLKYYTTLCIRLPDPDGKDKEEYDTYRACEYELQLLVNLIGREQAA